MFDQLPNEQGGFEWYAFWSISRVITSFVAGFFEIMPRIHDRRQESYFNKFRYKATRCSSKSYRGFVHVWKTRKGIFHVFV